MTDGLLPYPALPRKRKARRFPARRSIRPEPLAVHATPLPADPQVLTVHGVQAGSKEEYYVGRALDILGWTYDYQYTVDFGRSRRGGQVLDFLVHTPVRWTVVDVRGVYWHTGHREDSLYIERTVRRHHWRLLVAWDYNVPSLEAAISFLRMKLF